MSLKKFFQKIGAFFQRLFEGLLPELKKAVHVGVTITDAIKNFDLTHPGAADILTAIIPGEWDDNLKNKIRENLPKIMTELRLVDTTLNLTDPNEIMAAAIKVLQQLSGDYRSAFLNSASIVIAQVAADGKFDWNDVVYLEKWYYDHRAGLNIPV